MTDDVRLPESARLRERAASLVPAWTHTLSKNPTQWMQGIAPAFLARGAGAHVWDVDGNRYVDLPMALGPIILGHAHPVVTEAITKQLQDGITFTLPHPIELEVAELVLDRVPGVERIRFGKTGSDATSAAVRLARAVTGRDHVLAAGYHGWHDWFIATTTRDLGVPAAVKELSGTFPYGDLEGLRERLEARRGLVAAVVLEPSGAEVPADGYLQGVIDLAHEHGALVVFDEVITGFRLGRGGAQERYGVQADLVAFGKALGNGMPISALAGRAEHMDVLNDVFFSGTHGGEILSLAAARATLGVLDADAYARLYSAGAWLRARVEVSVATHDLSHLVSVSGEDPRTLVLVSEPDGADGLWAKSLVQQEMARRGVLYNGNNFICLAHSDEDLEQVADAYDAGFSALARGLSSGGAAGVLALLEADALSPAFRAVR
ncbi:aminotransferase class III-fold pyridoxal phosphate-dependent enzyme [Patulibacter sp.]|uniref:aminotransferase class III-fold pyridoxal phosphate-dependent enzyme n=1 Tax=Patulibacter sp. TaxID=1912859 RepID=UPI002720CEEF|nr:aminotransferase class III-fold pyridoxal phosphate-dependent enzyme [Patulibacter sp.]MDO9408801.1 aminotransferase class III-fold pyridoxal phosphate-dependent enzyme [Patulibacter sp.]